ncbi:hypothetical protein WME75_44055 [Sorangium sp. So ce1014]|uniref:hypothetical protein n=1 Tax=Sorangium sp. So ce1014 TaxID=3133326 RepID=UPI003F5E7A1D
MSTNVPEGAFAPRASRALLSGISSSCCPALARRSPDRAADARLSGGSGIAGDRLTMVVKDASIEEEPVLGERQANVPAVFPRVLSEARRADERLVSLVHERPVATLCVVAAVGYLIGRVVTRLG